MGNMIVSPSAVKNIDNKVGDPSSASAVTGSDAFSKINTLNNNIATKSTVTQKSGTVGTVSVPANGMAVINFTYPSKSGYTAGPCSFTVNHDLCYVGFNVIEGKVNVFNNHSASQTVTVEYSCIFFK